MPVYTFRCTLHTPPVEGDVLRPDYDTTPPNCPAEVVTERLVDGIWVWDGWTKQCGAPMSRVYTPFGFRRPMPAHYNVAAGAYVGGEKQLLEHYKVKSAEDSARLGMEVRYAPLDSQEQRAVSVTDDHLHTSAAQLEDSEREYRKRGWTERRQMWL